MRGRCHGHAAGPEGPRRAAASTARAFPSDIPHGHFIHRHGPRRLRDWGLLDRVLATNCPRVTQFTSDMGDFPLTGTDLAADGVPLGLGPRRTALDAVLIEAAVDAGAEFREGTRCASCASTATACTGIDGEQADLVIGADGRNSRVAKQVDAPVTYEKPAVSVWYFSYWSGVPEAGISVHVRDRTAVFAFPTNDDLFAVFIAWPLTELARVKRDIEAAMHEVIDGHARARRAHPRGHARGTRLRRDAAAELRAQAFGPGWALVGDAGVHKDPFMALGVCDAPARRRAARRRPSTTCSRVRAAPQRGDAAGLRPNFGAAHLMAPPDMLAFRQTLRGDQAATNRFYLEREGMLAAS